ncbi:MAG: hypothetical protein QOH06_1037 [Acidobacteriota bacterium]|jgi:hypothetical protein|nr:hypothetical protein [Acidobacteriota bacterium]
MLPRFGDPDIYPSVRFRAPELPSLHRVPRGGSPASTVLLSSLTSRHPSAQSRLPLSWTYRLCAPDSLLRPEDALGRKPGSLVSRGPSPALLRRRWQDLPGSWSDPGSRMPCSLTPVGLLAPGHCGAGVLSPLSETWTTPTTRAFRGSFTRPPTSLSTLRRRPRGISPRKTRFRLVANLCRAGFSPAGSQLKGFRSVDNCLHRFPLSQAYPGALRLTHV